VLGELKCKKTQHDFNDAEIEESSTEEKSHHAIKPRELQLMVDHLTWNRWQAVVTKLSK
jgi:hypothetical protein